MYTGLGTDCRYVLLCAMAREPGRVFTTAELGALLDVAIGEMGRAPGRKASDALRMPVGRGWVVRVGRGRYRFGVMPPTSLRRAQRWVAAMHRGLDRPARSAYANWRPPPPPLAPMSTAAHPTAA